MIRPPEAQARAPLTLSSRDVARVLGVGEATVKRWADDGILPCAKTPGGHRRFPLSAVAAFRRQQPGWEEVWPETPDLARHKLLERALAGDGEGMARLVLSGLDRGLPLEELCDDWLGPMLVHVGDSWAAGELAVAQEHIASAAVSEMIAQVAPLLVREPVRGVAVTGCLPGERHELGGRLAGLILRLMQFRVIHSGADTPLADLMAEVKRGRADLLVLSGQIQQPEALDALGTLGAWGLRQKARVIVGGNGFSGQDLPSGVEWLGSFKALKRAVQLTPPRARAPATLRRSDRSE